MKTLRAYLEGNNISGFKPNELNEVLLLVYNILKWAVRDQADTLILGPVGFSWSKQGDIVGDFPVKGISPKPTYAEAFRQVLERDQIVRINLTEVLSSPQELIFKIKSG